MYRNQMFRPRPVPQQPQGGPRNFGSDLHALLEGMSRIVQLLFTGIPVITFVGTIARYLWKFVGFVGRSAARALPSIQQAALEGETVWAESGVSWNRVKVMTLLAVALVGVRILMRKRQIQAEETWDSSSSSEEEFEVPEEQPQPYSLKSEEDRGAQQSLPQYEEQAPAYPDDFWDQYS